MYPLVLLRDCDNGCVFCAQDGLAPLGEKTLKDVRSELAAARQEHEAVTFAGGEPTLSPHLVETVRAAHEMGFRELVLETNGARLDTALARSLKGAGLTAVHASLHGADARVHEYHTGREGSFARVLGAMRAARGAGLRLVVTTVVTRSNFRELSRLGPFVSRQGAEAWALSFARAAGRAAGSSSRVVPRYGMAVPYALHALEAAPRDLAVLFSGVPSCLLGPYARRALAEAERAFGPMCAACGARDRCTGVEPSYLARFDGDELSATPEVTRDRDVEALAPLFAGPGELAVPLAASARPSTEARRALPLLGKVKPAVAEAPAGTVRRSGDALREIFPDLFASTDAGEGSGEGVKRGTP